jgi:N,N'-diacetyllegionaminate synthase
VTSNLLIVAELHPQHGGDFGLVREMIRTAKLNGADIAKFQLYDAVALLGSDQWRYLEFTQEQTAQVKQWCEEDDLEFMASVFDSERLQWCEELGVRRYKIASRTVVGDAALCRAILDLGKETIISLGSWTGDGKPFGTSDQVRYLYCKAKYPALLSDLGDFPEDFPGAGLAGYSDHTLGIEVPLLAIARGASIVEKHYTLDKTRGRATEKGHVGSMTPPELDDLRRTGGLIFRARRAIQAARPTP